MDNVTDDKHRAIVPRSALTPDVSMSSCFVFPIHAVVKQTPVLVFYIIQSICWKFSSKCLSEGRNGIELKTIRSLARRSNQLEQRRHKVSKNKNG